MTLFRMVWALASSMLLLGPSIASAQHQIVCTGEAAGGYAAFPDLCRLKNGELFCVFYSGYVHVSTPNAKYARRESWLRPPEIGCDELAAEHFSSTTGSVGGPG